MVLDFAFSATMILFITCDVNQAKNELLNLVPIFEIVLDIPSLNFLDLFSSFASSSSILWL